MNESQDRDIERRYAEININRSRGRAPHKPLLLAWAIARCLRGEERLVPYDLAADALVGLLDAFGPHRSGNPRDPFWRLKNDERVWEVDAPNPDILERARPPAPSQLSANGVRAGLSGDDYDYFLANPRMAWRVAGRLVDDHFPESLRDAVLSAAGFDDAEPPDADNGAIPALSTRAPDLRLRKRVLEIYGERCAVCGFGMTVSGNPAALDAVRLRWRSYDGPAEPRNALCLCAVHRAAFDAGGFTLMRRGHIFVAIVSSAVGGDSLPALSRHHDMPIAVPDLADARPEQAYIRWHNKEVFRTPDELGEMRNERDGIR